jgi:membrane-associated phospholipid phosphatase
MKKSVVRVFFLCGLLLFHAPLSAAPNAAASASDDSARPLSVWYNFGDNWVGSVTRNYGLHFVVGGLGTWAMIETELDWKLRQEADKSQFLKDTGIPQLIIGNFVPVFTPLTLYWIGSANGDERMVSTAAALTQALIITLSIQTPLKMISGRPSLGLIGERNDRKDNFSGEFNWFNMDFIRGWPSGHTANSFAAAAVISEMYDDKPLLKIGVWTYSIAMGISMAVSVHWASDVFAGALIGYAVGKTVGRSYARPHEQMARNTFLSFSMNAVGINFRI